MRQFRKNVADYASKRIITKTD